MDGVILDIVNNRDIGNIILDYLSMVELSQFNLSRKCALNELDAKSYNIFLREKVQVKIRLFPTYPDYLRYVILLHLRYEQSTILRLLKREPAYMIEWLTRTSTIGSCIGKALCVYAINHDWIIRQLATVSPKYELTDIIAQLMVQRRNELVIWIVQNCQVYTPDLPRLICVGITNAQTNIIMELVKFAPPAIYFDYDPLYTAITSNPGYIPVLLEQKMYWDSCKNKYIRAVLYSSFELEETGVVLTHFNISQQDVESVISQCPDINRDRVIKIRSFYGDNNRCLIL